jgi:hypothetical protein
LSAAGLLEQVVQALDAAGIPRMLVGSFASSTHGAPRATQDIDLVVDPTPEALDRFVVAFDPTWSMSAPLHMRRWRVATSST